MGPAPAFSLKRACLNSQIIPQIRSRFRQASGGVIWNIFCPVKDEQGWELPQKGFGTLRHRLFPHCERLASGHCITSETRVTDRSGARFKGFFFLFLLFFYSFGSVRKQSKKSLLYQPLQDHTIPPTSILFHLL